LDKKGLKKAKAETGGWSQLEQKMGKGAQRFAD